VDPPGNALVKSSKVGLVPIENPRAGASIEKEPFQRLDNNDSIVCMQRDGYSSVAPVPTRLQFLKAHKCFGTRFRNGDAVNNEVF